MKLSAWIPGLVPMLESRADEIFLIHPKIRWAGLTTNKGQIIFSKMRPGVESYTPEEDDRFLMEFGALIMNGITQRSALGSVIANTFPSRTRRQRN